MSVLSSLIDSEDDRILGCILVGTDRRFRGEGVIQAVSSSLWVNVTLCTLPHPL